MITSKDPLIIDIAHWRLSDKAFQEERKAKWPIIEEVLSICCSKNKKAINLIKKYYLQGELPDWQAVNDATEPGDRMFRHLDIATFLWLHPSPDIDVLLPLTKAYYAGYGRLPQDIQSGMTFLFNWGVLICSHNGEWHADWKPKFPAFEGKGRLLFNLIYDCLNGFTFELEVKSLYRMEKTHNISSPKWATFSLSTLWLCHKKLNDNSTEMLLQHEEIIRFSFNVINNNPNDVAYWFENYLEDQTLALYRIFNFNTEKEGNTPRTQYVDLVRKILNEGEILPEIKNLWEKIKNDEVIVKNPWKL